MHITGFPAICDTTLWAAVMRATYSGVSGTFDGTDLKSMVAIGLFLGNAWSYFHASPPTIWTRIAPRECYFLGFFTSSAGNGTQRMEFVASSNLQSIRSNLC